ncbi:MAG: histidine--tRNA ligase [Clostridium sp. CAG:307_30_263]|nr:MAG: histidine--tRNA ligase [Clostridium sp. CAG:307_30_263]
MIKQPLKGMNDFIPEEAGLRDYMINQILEVYHQFGFERIYTPAIEDIENINNKEGGDNQKLIFKILKRGEKLEEAINASQFDDLSDMGLRYDLTLPLTRFYANNKASLPQVGKFIQIDRVYRAERPQRGRCREFVQCDIDVIGDESYNAEIELITATGRALLRLPIGDFFIRVNNRQVLKAVLLSFGFEEDSLDNICIILDKLDKIGVDGVVNELEEASYGHDAILKLKDLISRPVTLDMIEKIIPQNPNLEILNNVIDGANALANSKYNVVYDFTLVRGQGYYTGCVFEIASSKFGGTIGGGGRYDNLIGKFTGEATPAVGFSIGFERIYAILHEIGFKVPGRKKLAIIYKNDYIGAFKLADTYRNTYEVSMYAFPKKVGKLLNRLELQGFNAYIIYDKDNDENNLNTIDANN